MGDYDDKTKCEHYMVGDLVRFVGYDYSPDYVYTDHFKTRAEGFGLITETKMNAASEYDVDLYRVYWFNSGQPTWVPGAHVRLVYIKK